MRVFEVEEKFKFPQVIAVRVRGGHEKHMFRAMKKLAKFFDAKPTLVNLIAVAEYHGYGLGYFNGFYFAVELDSEMDEFLGSTPEAWVLMVESEPDEAIVKVIA